MHLEIVSPEATLYSGEATLVTLPGATGGFQLLDNHAPIIASLEKGIVRIKGATVTDKKVKNYFTVGKEPGELKLMINSGTVEMNDNKVIVLAD